MTSVSPGSPGVANATRGPEPVTAIVPAAGVGERLGRGTPKAFATLCGRPMVAWSLLSLARSGAVSAVVLVVPPGFEAAVEGAALEAEAGALPLSVVAGGGTRQESVRRGLEAVQPGVRFVLCHDAARPLASPGLFARVLEPLLTGSADGVVPVAPSPDTVKRVRSGAVVETLPREEIGLAQTPQGFVSGALREAHRRAADRGPGATDDAMLLESAGYRVAAVPGEGTNFKVTTEEDFARAEAVLRGRGRSGVPGWDEPGSGAAGSGSS